MADFIAEKFEGKLSYEAPRIMDLVVPAGVVQGASGPDGGKAYYEDDEQEE